MEVNQKLAVAKAKADEANLDKTRFLAAASHDLLQPLNAARLYAASLVERTMTADEALMARNIDVSLSSVEEILSALIDLSRMDAGNIEPEIADVPLAEIFQRLQVLFEPQARSKGLRLRIVPTTAGVRADRRLLRRLLQNLVSNAVKYTTRGSVLIGARRSGDRVVVQVIDTGPGIPQSQHELIFKEFQRLRENARLRRGSDGLDDRRAHLPGDRLADRDPLEPGARLHILGVAAACRDQARSRRRAPPGDAGRFDRRTGDAMRRRRAFRAGRHAHAARRLGLRRALRDLERNGTCHPRA
jgi:hypothetical protein